MWISSWICGWLVSRLGSLRIIDSWNWCSTRSFCGRCAVAVSPASQAVTALMSAARSSAYQLRRKSRLGRASYPDLMPLLAAVIDAGSAGATCSWT